jgi:geranylgeranyl diphosphate synthase type I
MELSDFNAFVSTANTRLRERFAIWRADVPQTDATPAPTDMFDAVEDLTLRGGKRLRPALAFYAARCFDHAIGEDSLLDAVLTLELLQSALLIHDDIMDADLERRGGPAVHAHLGMLSGNRRLGDSLGILAGSLAYSLAHSLLATADIPDARRAAAYAELASIERDVVYGQHLDLVGGAKPALVQGFKTTSYTTRGPVRFGAALAGAAGPDYDAFDRFAAPLGRAFQLRDDLLGAFGTPSRTGKPVGNDLRAGKDNALVKRALETGDTRQHAVLEGVLGRSDATDDDIEQACNVLIQTGAKQHIEEEAHRLLDQSLDVLHGIHWLKDGVEPLRFLATRMVERSH